MTEEIRLKMRRLDELLQKKETEVLSDKEKREFIFLKLAAERKWQPSAKTRQNAIIKELDGVRAELDIISRMTTSERKIEDVQDKKRRLKNRLDKLKIQRDGLIEKSIEENALFQAELSALSDADNFEISMFWDSEENL